VGKRREESGGKIPSYAIALGLRISAPCTNTTNGNDRHTGVDRGAAPQWSGKKRIFVKIEGLSS